MCVMPYRESEIHTDHRDKIIAAAIELRAAMRNHEKHVDEAYQYHRDYPKLFNGEWQQEWEKKNRELLKASISTQDKLFALLDGMTSAAPAAGTEAALLAGNPYIPGLDAQLVVTSVDPLTKTVTLDAIRDIDDDEAPEGEDASLEVVKGGR